MSLSRKILKSVQASLPQLRLCNDLLVIPPTRRIARLFLIERTPYKGLFYLWRVVLPLYTPPIGFLRLNYGNRLAGADHIQLDKDALDKSVELVTKLISESIADTAMISTLQDFFDHISWMIGSDQISFLLDLALTYCVLGRHSEAPTGPYPRQIHRLAAGRFFAEATQVEKENRARGTQPSTFDRQASPRRGSLARNRDGSARLRGENRGLGEGEYRATQVGWLVARS